MFSCSRRKRRASLSIPAKQRWQEPGTLLWRSVPDSSLRMPVSKLSSISRDKLKSKLEDLGVKVVSSISKNTDYVIVGSDAGSKLEKAKALNIEIIKDENLDTFLIQNEN